MEELKLGCCMCWCLWIGLNYRLVDRLLPEGRVAGFLCSTAGVGWAHTGCSMTEAKEAAASKTHGKSGPLTIFLFAFGLFCGGPWDDVLCLRRAGGGG